MLANINRARHLTTPIVYPSPRSLTTKNPPTFTYSHTHTFTQASDTNTNTQIVVRIRLPRQFERIYCDYAQNYDFDALLLLLVATSIRRRFDASLTVESQSYSLVIFESETPDKKTGWMVANRMWMMVGSVVQND